MYAADFAVKEAHKWLGARAREDGRVCGDGEVPWGLLLGLPAPAREMDTPQSRCGVPTQSGRNSVCAEAPGPVLAAPDLLGP